ncbi:MAG: hypothetical protein H0X40_19310 [Chthoniobacterales bacterium]|nr:hypothetical protein [Chthoniobacterales bacterium]
MRLACWRRCSTVANFYGFLHSLGKLNLKKKFAAARRVGQHAGRMRYPE